MCKHILPASGPGFFVLFISRWSRAVEKQIWTAQRHSQLRAVFTVHMDVQSGMARLHKQAWFRLCRMRGGEKQTLSESMVYSRSIQNQSRLLSVCEIHARWPLPFLSYPSFLSCSFSIWQSQAHSLTWNRPEWDKGLNVKGWADRLGWVHTTKSPVHWSSAVTVFGSTSLIFSFSLSLHLPTRAFSHT